MNHSAFNFFEAVGFLADVLDFVDSNMPVAEVGRWSACRKVCRPRWHTSTPHEIRTRAKNLTICLHASGVPVPVIALRSDGRMSFPEYCSVQGISGHRFSDLIRTVRSNENVQGLRREDYRVG